MNLWQIARQIQYKLRAAVWPGSSTKIFDSQSVKIIEQGQEEPALYEGLIPPLAIIGPIGGYSDPVGGGEEASIVERTLDVTLVAVNQADRTGEAAVVGAVRQGGTDSRGRGILELEPVLFIAISRLVSNNGIHIAFGAFGAAAVRRGAGDYWIAIQDYQFRSWCGTAKFYAPPERIQAAVTTGTVVLTWRNPADRWDLFRVRLVRKAGSTPPTSVSDGTILALPSNLPTTFSDSPGVGTFSYSLFASYSEFDSSPQVDDAYSNPATVAGVVTF